MIFLFFCFFAPAEGRGGGGGDSVLFIEAKEEGWRQVWRPNGWQAKRHGSPSVTSLALLLTHAHTEALKMYNRKNESQKAAMFPLLPVDRGPTGSLLRSESGGGFMQFRETGVELKVLKVQIHRQTDISIIHRRSQIKCLNQRETISNKKGLVVKNDIMNNLQRFQC